MEISIQSETPERLNADTGHVPVSEAQSSPLLGRRPAVVRLGIIGCGRVAEQCHIPGALNAPSAELVGIADPAPDRLELIRGAFRLSCLATTSHTDLLGRVDAVVLAVPNYLHYPLAAECLRAGVHVLCEKPLANSTQEARDLCQLAESRALILAVGYVKRFEPNFELMKQLIDSRFLGALDHFEFVYGTAGGWAPVSSYNLNRERAGGGVLMITGCHLLDRMLSWFGEPVGVTFSDDSHGGVEANCTAVFTFPSGLVGEVRLSKTLALSNGFRLYGERGCIDIRDSQHDSVTFFPADRPHCQHEISERYGRHSFSDTQYFSLQIEDFATAIRLGTRPRVTGREGLASVALIERCYQSRTPLREPWACESLGAVRSDAAAKDQESRKRASMSGPDTSRTERVLVTGATGFVGSRLCEVLHLTTDLPFRALVHSSGRASNIARYPLDLVAGDLTDLSAVRAAIAGCSMVVHLARGSDDVMVRGMKNLLRAAVEANVRRFVHISSVAVYGHTPNAAAASEMAPARRTGNPYGDIKLDQERLVTSYGRRFGLPFVILRPPHILGPYSHFVDAVSQRLRAGTLPIVDDGANVCNLVYVDNLIHGILLSLEAPGAVGETFFITDRERVTWQRCLDDFGGMFGVEVPHARARELETPTRPGRWESVRAVGSVMLANEFRAAVVGVPVLGTLASAFSKAYARIPEKRRRYIRSRLNLSSSPLAPPRQVRYDATDYLISSQRRTVVHSCAKAERVLGYTAPIGYAQALDMTRAWLRFARMI